MFHASEDTNGASMPGVICASMPLVAASISVPPAPVSRGRALRGSQLHAGTSGNTASVRTARWRASKVLIP
jgi:hypothetical protein